MNTFTQFSFTPNRIISFLLFVTSSFSTYTAKAQCGTTSYVGGTSSGVSTGAALQQNIAVDGNGTPYVAYKDGTSSPANKITIIKYNGTSWVTVGSALAAGAAPAMGVAPDNTPYVAFVPTSTSKLTVMKFDGSSWNTVGAASLSAGTPNYVNLRFAPSGTPYVSFTDAGSNSRVTVLKFDGTSWVTLGSAGFSFSNSMNTNYTSLAVDRSGTPYVAFSDVGASTSGAIEVMKFNGTAWVQVGGAAASGNNRGSWCSLAIDPAGHPYVAYEEFAAPNYGDVMEYNGSSWVAIGTGVSLESVIYNALAIDSFSNVYYMYSSAPANSRKSDLLMYNGSTWTTLATNFTGTSNLPTMALSPTGTPYMSYYDGATSPVNRLMVQTISYSTGITPGSNPSVGQGSTVAHLGYTGAAGTPNQYSISWTAAAKAAGFADVTNASLAATPIDITVPAAAPLGTYPALLSVANSSGCISGTYSINVQVTTPLPVTLQSFTGIKKNGNTLNWATTTTTAIKFELQRSNDGSNFVTIANIGINTMGNYSYTDYTAGSDNYYRLLIINEDGNKQYSKIISLNTDEVSNINIYPNPATTNIIVTGLSNGMSIQISDMAGRILNTQAINTDNGSKNIAVADYAQGLYQLSILKGKKAIKTLKLIKK